MYLRLILSILVLSSLIGCGTGTSGSDTNSGLSLVVDDQEISFYSRLKLKEISTDKPVFLVVHNSFIDGSLNKVLLAKQYQAGQYADDEVVLSSPMRVGSATSYGDLFHAVLYVDTDGNNEFNIDNDEIALNRFGQSISQSFKVTESDRTSDAEIRIDTDQDVAFVWTEVVDDLDGFSLDTENTDAIVLNSGWRYKIDNVVADSYTLRFLDKAGDVVTELKNGAAVDYFLVDDTFVENVVSYDGGADSGIQGLVSIK